MENDIEMDGPRKRLPAYLWDLAEGREPVPQSLADIADSHLKAIQKEM